MSRSWGNDRSSVEKAIPLVMAESARVCRGYISVFNEDQKIPALCSGSATDLMALTDTCLAWYSFSNFAVFIHALLTRHQDRKDEVIALVQSATAQSNFLWKNGLISQSDDGFNPSKLLAARILFPGLAVHVPIEDDTVKGYEYALKKCVGSADTIEAMIQRFQRTNTLMLNALATKGAAEKLLG